MTDKEAANLATARLLDYFARRTDWQRRLWQPGTITLLDESLEAGQLFQSGHLREKTVRQLASTANKTAGPDVGVGSSAVRRAITGALSELTNGPLGVFQLEHLLHSARETYLQRWEVELSENPDSLTTELASRLVAGHLLGLGLSPHQLHRWTTWLSRNQPPLSLSDLFRAAHEMTKQHTLQSFEVFVPFLALDRQGQTMPPEWLEPAASTQWLRDNAPHRNVRHNGGFLLVVEAMDPWAAADDVSDQMEGLAARIAVGQPGTSHFRPAAEVFVKGSDQQFKLSRPRRQVDIHSLTRQNALFEVSVPTLTSRLRSAIDLVAPLETGAPGSAVAGGWAAIEAVLARPDTPNVEAASDLAVLVACSYPRAELTPLTYAYEREHSDPLATQIDSATSNQQRCAFLGQAIKSGKGLTFSGLSDQAAYQRLQEIVKDPQSVLGRIINYVDGALRRLYRQRNLVLHAGITDSVAMQTALRTVPPLVGAGFDRLIHDALTTTDSNPLRLVARARAELQLCGHSGEVECWDLLGH